MTNLAASNTFRDKSASLNGLLSQHLNQISARVLPYLALTALCAASVPVLAATAPDLGSNSPFAVVSETYSNSTAGTAITGDVCYTTGPSVDPTIAGITETPCAPERGTDQNVALDDLNSQSCQTLGSAVALNEISINAGPPGSFLPVATPAPAP